MISENISVGEWKKLSYKEKTDAIKEYFDSIEIVELSEKTIESLKSKVRELGEIKLFDFLVGS